MRTHLKLCLLTSLLLLLSLPCAAQQDPVKRIDLYVRTEMARQKIPGLSLAIVRNGKISTLRSYGFANLEHQVPVTPETIFQSGSIGKQFTAAALMILVQDGKISLDDRVTKYFPDAPATWQSITIRQLLTHTSGMQDFPPDLDLRRDYTEEEYLASFKKAPLSFAPGSRWDYSNAGYATLGILIRKVTGMFYGDFLKARIFEPLGMTTARIISEADIVPHRAAGYRLVAGEIKNQQWVSPSTNSTADGSLYFSILDLVKWDAALYSESPLRQSTLAQIFAPTRLSDGGTKGYGFGWFTDTMHNRRIMFHGGAWQGFKSFILRFPDDKLSIIFFANSWELRDFKFARGLAALFYPEFTLPEIKTIEDDDPKTRAAVRRVLLQLSKGELNADAFTADGRSEMTVDRVKKIRENLESLSLPVAVISLSELIERRDENNLRVFRYLLTDIGQTLECTVKVTKDDKIAAIELTRKG
ncbi:MAG TPA: serine hydrolase domain-containing protein [Pyrinomonadaceae bacterium]|nr:serine hydrolase domain-containing protein [Pyrinomonadaceae bacterium]